MYDPINDRTMTRAELVKEALNNKMYEGETRKRKPVNENESIYERQMEQELTQRKFEEFVKKVKTDLVFESIYAIYEPTLKKRTSPRTTGLAKQLVKEFVEDKNPNTLLREFKTKSSLLSEVYSLVNKYSNLIIERVDKKNPVTYNIDTELRDDFFDNLKTEDFESMSTIINQRIASAIDDFVVDNIQTKAEIQDIVNQTKERIDTKKQITKESAEEYNLLGKFRIQNLKERKRQGILNALVYNITESAIKNPQLNEIYFDNGKPNIDLIVDEATTIYSFLETVNSCRLDKVDEKYIKNFLDGFKYKK